MPSLGQPIVVGGGIQGAPPLVANHFLKLATVTPPTANTSARLIEQATSIEVLGDAVGSTSIGPSADANGVSTIAIGTNVSTVTAVLRQIVIGESITAGNQNTIIIGSISTGGSLIASGYVQVGYNFSYTTAPSSSVMIGHGISGAGNTSVGIGDTVNIGGNGAVAVGNQARAALNSVSVGTLAQSGAGGSVAHICIGASALGPSGQNAVILIGNRAGNNPADVLAGDMVLGHQDNSNSSFTSRWYLGGPFHAAGVAVPALTLQAKKSSGTNIAAGDLTVIAPLATGNAAGGELVFSTGTVGASGVASQAITERLRIGRSGVVTIATPTVAATHSLIVNALGGTTAAIRLNGVADVSGVSAGTLGNTPGLGGDPSIWIELNVAGTRYGIPLWPL